MKVKGAVYLVGAGPGDPGLLTLRGAELLAQADVVVYDALVNRNLLRLAPASAELVYAGKRSREHAIPQEKLNVLLVAKAREGKRVVRLKGGDPYIFGRGGEEAEELARAKVHFEVVPGISSFVAAPNYAGIPITHRDHCSSFTVLTGHEESDKNDNAVDLEQLAKSAGTKVILMGVERIKHLAESLITHGMDASTPIAMVRWGTTGRQQTIESTLAGIADLVATTNFAAPAVAVIGGVVKLRGQLNWFEQRPLFGQRIVVTRTREQASQLSRQLLDLGAEVLEIPTIKVLAPDEKRPIAEALLEIGSYDWLVFTSPNGVTAFFDYFFKSFEDVRAIGGVRIAAVGPGTAAKVSEVRLKVDLMPQEHLTSKIAGAFAKLQSVENLKILLLRAQVANRDLPKALEEMGAIVDDVAIYKTVAETDDIHGAAEDLLENGADWITFTSSSTIEHFHNRFNLPELVGKFPSIKLLTIGPETSKALHTLGLSPTLEASNHTIDGLVAALEKTVRRSDGKTVGR